jgi:hypothetical protein
MLHEPERQAALAVVAGVGDGSLLQQAMLFDLPTQQAAWRVADVASVFAGA